MNALPALAAAPAHAAPPSDSFVDDDAAGDGDFAAALELAREPVKPGVDAKTRASDKAATRACPGAHAKPARAHEEAHDAPPDDPTAGIDSAQMPEAPETTSSTAPDLAVLLPGWPPTPATLTPPTAATPTTVVASAAPETKLAAPALVDGRAPTALLLAAGVPPAGPQTASADHRDAVAPSAPLHSTSIADKPGPSAVRRETDDEPLQPMRSARGPIENLPSLPVAPVGVAPTSPATAPSAAAASGHPASSAASVFEARVSPSIDSPAFAPALANQVSWLAREGVQHARLSLHPAEMGPLAVKIVLDGTQARIDFSADMAGTRAAIEASLPTLAAALHDSGLTLAGGGVFDGQARHGGPDGESAQQRRHGPRDRALPQDATLGAKAAGRLGRGLVDLVA